MSARTIEASIDAWLPDHVGISAADLLSMDALRLVNGFGYSVHDMAPRWLKVGTARITVEIADVDAFVDLQINALKEARQKVLADAQLKATEIDRQIQSLLAIEHDTGAAS